MTFKEKVASLRLLQYRYYCISVSVVLFAASIFVWVSRGESKFGIDFAGGSELLVKLEKPIELGELRKILSENNYPGAIVQGVGESVARTTGLSEVSIRVANLSQGTSMPSVKQVVKEKWDANLKVLREETVGPLLGKKIKRDGIFAFACSLIAVLIYIAFRFELRFSVGAVIALIHDGVICTGVFLMTGGELSSQVLAAVLTIVGYSLTDTIVIYDRVRENLALAKSGKSKLKGESLFELTDRSITQTLSRTMLTSVLTFLVVFILWLVGGEGLSDLAFTMTVGVVVGTYSTIFVACPLMIWLASGSTNGAKAAT